MQKLQCNYQAALFFSSILSLSALAALTYLTLQDAQTELLHTQMELDRLYEVSALQENVLPADRPDTPPVNLVPLQRKNIDVLKERIEKKYNIRIHVYDASILQETLGIDAHPYPPQSLEKHLHNLYGWLQKYPKEYIEYTGLRSIYLFKGWEKDGVETAGFLLDKDSIGMQASEHILHHELFHVADIQNGGLEDNNTDWLAAKYGDAVPDLSFAPQLDVIAQELDREDRPFGYASAYGKYGGIEEDQATVAEELLTRTNLLFAWQEQEPPLAGAVRYMQNHFFTHSQEKMNEQYWQKLRDEEPITQWYWVEQ